MFSCPVASLCLLTRTHNRFDCTVSTKPPCAHNKCHSSPAGVTTKAPPFTIDLLLDHHSAIQASTELSLLLQLSLFAPLNLTSSLQSFRINGCLTLMSLTRPPGLNFRSKARRQQEMRPPHPRAYRRQSQIIHLRLLRYLRPTLKQ